MEVKVIMTWDIKPDRNQEYFEFVVREFAPGVNRLGLKPTQAWFTVYGNAPQIMMEARAEDLASMKKLLESPEWQQIHEKLMEYVINFNQKIVRLLPRFQF
jgi:hypothetical protein